MAINSNSLLRKYQMMYKSEAPFKRAIINTFTQQGYFVTPMQTKTVPGVPDLYVVGRVCFWVEAKYVNTSYYGAGGDIPIKVRFEPGQQTWALKHLKTSGRAVLCLITCNDGIFGYWMTKLYKGGLVPRSVLTPMTLNKLIFVE